MEEASSETCVLNDYHNSKLFNNIDDLVPISLSPPKNSVLNETECVKHIISNTNIIFDNIIQDNYENNNIDIDNANESIYLRKEKIKENGIYNDKTEEPISDVESEILEDFVAIDNQGLESTGKKFYLQYFINPDECKRLTKQWLTSQWISTSSKSSVTAVYVPFHAFSFTTNVTYKGQISKLYSGITHWLDIDGNFFNQHFQKTVCATTQINQDILNALQQKSAKFMYHSCTRLDQIPQNTNPDPKTEPKTLPIDIEVQKSWQALRGDVMETEKTNLKQILKDQYSANCIQTNTRNLKLEIRILDFKADVLYLPFYLSTFNHSSQVYELLVSGTYPVVEGGTPSSISKWLGYFWKQ